LKPSLTPKLDIALMHYPVINKNGQRIASAVTNLDLHDIARAAKTYGVRSFFVVTPLADQQVLVETIIGHWTAGVGGAYNPMRREALDLIHVKNSFEDMVDHIRLSDGQDPVTVVTTARSHHDSIGFARFRQLLFTGTSHLLLFGTAWGLADDFLSRADYRLAPVVGAPGYNHLSVRCAVAVVLDRILGQRR
jgi:hypothetical protein